MVLCLVHEMRGTPSVQYNLQLWALKSYAVLQRSKKHNGGRNIEQPSNMYYFLTHMQESHCRAVDVESLNTLF